MKLYQIKVTSVDYCVEYEDVDDGRNHSDAWYEKKIAEIKNDLPQELDLEIECEPEDLEYEIVDAISDETGWLINGFGYDISSEEELEDEDEHEREMPWGGTERVELPWDYSGHFE